MQQQVKIPIPLILITAFFLHLVFISIIIMLLLPDNQFLPFSKDPFSANKKGDSEPRQLIVNINQDNKPDYRNITLLSDKDSSGRGHLTPQNRDSWWSNFLKFRTRRGSRGRGQKGDKGDGSRDREALMTEQSDVTISLIRDSVSAYGHGGISDYVKIPNRSSYTRENAIYFTKDGSFSFNTAKFRHFEYFNNMIMKIRSNWYPPLMANAVLGNRSTPGRTRIMAIPSQDVKTYFILNRQGTIVQSGIVDSLGNRPLDEACLDAIRKSKTFGPVPGEVIRNKPFIVIPFVIRFR